MTQMLPIAALTAFGFTETEARIYCFLLEESPATGYRISHAIGKAAANTYKALAVLEQKGAIVVESGEHRLCRATPPDELLASLGQRFDAQRAEAKQALASLSTAKADTRVYQLTKVDQVLNRARAMLENAEEIVAFDITPGTAKLLAADVTKLAKRKVKIAAVTYAPEPAFSSPYSTVTPHADRVLDSWPGQQINMVVDARETLLAFLSQDCSRVIQAVWTNSRYLSVMQYNSLTAELLSYRYRELAGDRAHEAAELESISLTQGRPLGLAELFEESGEV